MRGHFNAYPMSVQKELVNGGSPIWWDDKRDTSVLFDLIYDVIEPEGVIQANHPVGSGGLFGSASYDLDFGEIDKPDYWSSNFGSFELLNDGHYESVLPYYIDMLSRGLRPIPMGVSDSHTNESGVGVNKTYVFSQGNAQEEIMEAVQAGAVVVSRGPMISAKISDDIAFGKTFVGSQEMEIDVYAPDWMRVDTVRVYENGIVIHETPFEGETLTFLLNPSQDAHYLVSAFGSSSMSPIYSETPWAMGSAIFIDLDGAGWTPVLEPLTED